MKALYTYLVENLNNISEAFKFKINRDSARIDYKYKPRDFDEFEEALKDIYDKEGQGDENNPVNLNVIDISGLTALCHPNNGRSPFVNIYFEYIDISQWDTSNLETLQNAFAYCYHLISLGDLSSWDISNVNSIKRMFDNCNKLKSIGDISNWDVRNIETMEDAFYDCENLNNIGDLSGWKMTKVNNTARMFSACFALSSLGDLSEWDMSSNNNMEAMFYGCRQLESIGDISNWNVTNVSSLKNTFGECRKLKTIGHLDDWNIRNCTDINGIFANCETLESVGDLSRWEISPNMRSLMSIFENCKNLKDVGDLDNWDISHIDKKSLAKNFKNSGIENLPSWENGNSEKDILKLCVKYDNGSYPDNPLRKASDPESYTLAYKIWAYAQEGEYTKPEILSKLGLVPTSYATMFANMVKRGIISYKRVGKKNIIIPEFKK